MTEITQVKLDEMLAGLEGVTPGPWEFNPGDDYYISAKAYPTECTHRFKGDDLGDMLAEIGNRPADFGEANAAHIARCDPDTMRALIALASQALRSQGEAVGVRVRQMKWLGLTCPTTVGVYRIKELSGQSALTYENSFTAYYDTLDAAKAAAQDDYERRVMAALTHPAPQEAGDVKAFALGDRVTKTKGAAWTGRVVGFYSTALTPIGYAVESENEPGSVQIYPETALSTLTEGSTDE